MTDYNIMLQRVQSQIRQLQLTMEQVKTQLKPALMQEMQLMSVLRSLEEQKQEHEKNKSNEEPLDTTQGNG
jgi:hypothetical protein